MLSIAEGGEVGQQTIAKSPVVVLQWGFIAGAFGYCS
jgi:hypothetical protein